jgi:hypothetical protein
MHRKLTSPKANLTTPEQTLKKPQAEPEPTTGHKAYTNPIKEPKTNHKEAANEA